MITKFKAFVAVALVAALAATAVYADSRRQIDARSTMRSVIYKSARQPAVSSAAYKAATALSALTIGLPVAMTTTIPSAVGGRNIILTFVDANTNSSLTLQCDGFDQWNRPISERLPATGTYATTSGLSEVGTKIFSKVTSCTPLAAVVGDVTIDTVAVGTGNKLGLPFQFQPDLHEIQNAVLVVANNTTITAKTINTTNFDTTNFAINAALFSGSAIVLGDEVEIQYFSDDRTPDNIDFPAR